MNRYPPLPHDVEEALAKGRRLEWWTLSALLTIILVMYFVVGSSQAMRTAWIEDLLSLIPPALFLVSAHIEKKHPTRSYPYGFHRTGSLAFFAAACALAAMGAILLFEASSTLLKAEHPTVGTVLLFGNEVWLGWLMIAALAYSIVPPVILGRLKRPVARTINDKILYTDADMNAADWQTGAAGIVGISGIAFGFWWADSLAAALISLSILWDGINNCRTALAELLDGAPRAIDSPAISQTAERVRTALEAENPGKRVQIRESGRFIRAVVVPHDNTVLDADAARTILGDEAWRLIEVSYAHGTLDGGDAQTAGNTPKLRPGRSRPHS